MYVPQTDSEKEPQCEKFLWDQFSKAAERLNKADKKCKT